MNKQELIDDIKKITYSDLDYNSPERMLIQQKLMIVDKVRQLAEQPKVTVPKFVADWIEECKRNATLTDCLIGEYMDYKLIKEAEAFRAWRTDGENEEIAARAWMFGYEVEKEPLYEVQLPGTAWGTFLVKADDGDLLVWQNSMKGTPFTESEIKSIDERYWAFAVPVEEVK